MLTITRIYEIEASHHLPDHDGKCRNPHGHSYKVEVTVRGAYHLGEPDTTYDGIYKDGPKKGMVIDFADLDTVLKPLISSLDHHDLNELTEALSPPTAENLARYIAAGADELLAESNYMVKVLKTRVYETSRAYAEVSIE